MVEFSVPDIEENFGVDLDPGIFAEWEDEHALMASSVTVIEKGE